MAARDAALDVSSWAFPSLATAYRGLGIERLHPWQATCLGTAGVFPRATSSPRANLLFSAPTSGGKSLVAELIAFASLAPVNGSAPSPDSCALFILPYVALVEEKAASLSHLLRLAPELKLKVSALHGRKGSSELGKTRIAVCTPERASAVIDALIKTGSTGRLATVVVDEIHLVGEPGRGAVLESLLAKLLFASSAGGGGERSALQIVGMSATVPNLPELASWLGAATFQCTERPVHLTEYVCVDSDIRRVSSTGGGHAAVQHAHTQPGGAAAPPPDASTARLFERFAVVSARPSLPPRSDARSAILVPLVAETVASDGQCLVFAPDRRSVQEVAQLLRRQLGTEVTRLRRFLAVSPGVREPGALVAAAAAATAHVYEPTEASKVVDAAAAKMQPPLPPDKTARLRLQAMSQLQSLLSNGGVLPGGTPRPGATALVAAVREMSLLIREGVAYHHAGLPQEVRRVVEFAFKSGALGALVCTSTLAAGINLPARRVVVLGLHVGRELLPLAQYRQMVGRAGRTGLDPYGESILVLLPSAGPAALHHAAALVSQPLPSVRSCLLRHIDRDESDALRSITLRPAAAIETDAGCDEASRLRHIAEQHVVTVAAAVDAGHAASLSRLLLEVVDSGLARSPSHVFAVAACTLLSTQIGVGPVRALVGGCLAYLLARHVNMIEATAAGTVTGTAWLVDCVRSEGGAFDHAAVVLRTTQKGRAATSVSLSPFEAVLLYNDLACARRQLLLGSSLHALFCCVPITSAAFEPSWRGGSGESEVLSVHRLWDNVMLARWPDLGALARLVVPADVEGQSLHRRCVALLEPSFLSEARSSPDGARGAALLRAAGLVADPAAGCSRDAVGRVAALMHVRARRLVGAWLLQEFVCNPHALSDGPAGSLSSGAGTDLRGALRFDDVLRLVGLTPDTLDKVVDEAVSFAGSVVSFCLHLSWLQLARAVADARESLRRRFPPSLHLFAHLPAMTRTRAEALFAAGIESLTALAAADATFVVEALQAALPADVPPFDTSSDTTGDVTLLPPVGRELQRRGSATSAGLLREAAAAATILGSARAFLEENATARSAPLAAMMTSGSRFPSGRCLPAALQALGAGKRVRLGGPPLAITGAVAVQALEAFESATDCFKRLRPDVLHKKPAEPSASPSGTAAAAGVATLTSLANVAGGDADAAFFDADAEGPCRSDSCDSSSLGDESRSPSLSSNSSYSSGAMAEEAATQLTANVDGDEDAGAVSWLDVHDFPAVVLGSGGLPSADPFSWAPVKPNPTLAPAIAPGRAHSGYAAGLVPVVAGVASLKRGRKPPRLSVAGQTLHLAVDHGAAADAAPEEPDILETALEATPSRPAFAPPDPLVPCVQPVSTASLLCDPVVAPGPASTRNGARVAKSSGQRGASILMPSDGATVPTLLAGRSVPPPPQLLYLPRAAAGTFTVMAPICGAGVSESQAGQPRTLRAPAIALSVGPRAPTSTAVAVAAEPGGNGGTGCDEKLTVREELERATSTRIVRSLVSSTGCGDLAHRLSSCARSDSQLAVVPVTGSMPPWLTPPFGSAPGARPALLGVGWARGFLPTLMGYVSYAPAPPPPRESWRGARCVGPQQDRGRLHGGLLCVMAFLGVGQRLRSTTDAPAFAANAPLVGCAAVASVCRAFYSAYIDTVRLTDEVDAGAARQALQSVLTDSPLTVVPLAQVSLQRLRSASIDVVGEIADPCVAAWLLDPDKEPLRAPLLGGHVAASTDRLIIDHLAFCADRFLTDAEFSSALAVVHVRATEDTSSAVDFVGACRARLISQPVSVYGLSRGDSGAAAVVALASMLTAGLRLRGASLDMPFRHIEMPTLRVIADVMEGGFCVDHRILTHYVLHVTERLQVLDQGLKEMVSSHVSIDGGSFDPRRATDVASALFLHLRAPPPPGFGSDDALAELCQDPLLSAKATTNEQLAQLSASAPAPAFAALLLEFRELSVLLQRTLRPLQRAVRPDPRFGTLGASGIGIIRCHFDYQTATGRLSCADPNLQALPKDPISVRGVGRPSLFDELTRTDGLVWVRARGNLRGGRPQAPGLTRIPLDEALRDPFQARCMVVLARQSRVASAAAAARTGGEGRVGAIGALPAAEGENVGVLADAVPISHVCSRFGSVAAIHYSRDLTMPPMGSDDAGADTSRHGVTAAARAGQHLGQSVVAYWRAHGFSYSDAMAREVSQVSVLFRSMHGADPVAPQQAFCFPSDKVFRLAAPIFLPPPAPAGAPCGQQPWSTPLQIRVRDVLRARPGYTLVVADYAQIELRLLAHLSEDPALIAVVCGAEDVFKGVAAAWLGRTDCAAVTAAERAQVKQLVYALLYGASNSAFSAALGVSVAEAAKHTESFRRAFPGVFSFLKGVVEHCRKTGFVDTLCGRRRHLPLIACSDDARAGAAQGARRAARQAVNTTCQGSAADLIKLAAVNISYAIAAAFSGSAAGDPDLAATVGPRRQDAARIVLQVHDELVLEVLDEHVDAAVAIVRHCMEHVVALRVPLKAVMSTGERYGSLVAVPPPQPEAALGVPLARQEPQLPA